MNDQPLMLGNRPSDWEPYDDYFAPEMLDEAAQAELLAEFPPEQVGKLPRLTCPDCRQNRWGSCDRHPKAKCGECCNFISPAHIHLDYVGHGAVTKRLLEVDPTWWWEPMALDVNGMPLFNETHGGEPIGLWIKLHVHGMWRPGFGSVPPNQSDPEKVLIGDALRNAAMRFGIALDLWVKGHDLEDSPSPGGGEGSSQRGGGKSPRRAQPTPPDPQAQQQLVDDIEGVVTQLNTPGAEWLAEQMGTRYPGVTVTAELPPGDLRKIKALVDSAKVQGERAAIEAQALDDAMGSDPQGVPDDEVEA